MKVLFIGGTGTISSACSAEAVERGMDLFLLNRGTGRRKAPAEATLIEADFRDPDSVTRAMDGRTFDVVVDWIAFTPEQVEIDLEIFRGKVGQYVFISSASAYQTPPTTLPVTEGTPLGNPFWLYSRQKIACEERLMRAWREEGAPVTIVRPSHTYDQTSLPTVGKATDIARMQAGKPVVIHGDGTSLWTLTHHRDFARAFVPLLGDGRTIGDAFHITSDEALTWNAIYAALARAAGVELRAVHVPSELIARADPDLGAGLLGDKAHCMVFDNSKIKRIAAGWSAQIPFARGAEEIMAWHDAEPGRLNSDERMDRLMDRLVDAHRAFAA